MKGLTLVKGDGPHAQIIANFAFSGRIIKGRSGLRVLVENSFLYGVRGGKWIYNDSLPRRWIRWGGGNSPRVYKQSHCELTGTQIYCSGLSVKREVTTIIKKREFNNSCQRLKSNYRSHVSSC